MARVSRARILKREGEDVRIAAPVITEHARDPARGHARCVPRDVARAHEDAQAVVRDARERAARILADADAQADALASRRLREADAEGDARLAAALLSLKAEEEGRAERELTRLVDTSVALAERLVGAALEVDPSRIATMALLALKEARGARRVVIRANPLDAEALRAQLLGLGLPEGAVSVEEQGALSRGDLVLQTNLGTLDARLKPQLQRLAEALSRAGRRPD